MKKFINSFKYAIQGIISSIKVERNIKIHFIIALLVILGGIILQISNIEWLMCIALIFVVISAELFNTAIEITLDVVMPEKNSKVKKAKDISAGAVLMVSIGAAVIGIMIFVPKILSLMHWRM